MTLVTHLDAYARIRSDSRQVFDTSSAGLPYQVFRDDFSNFKFLEFDVMLFPEFWDLLKTCAEHYKDSEISFFAQDPDADTYYHSHFGVYGALALHSDLTSSDEYLAALRTEPGGSGPDALMYSVRVALWCGTSKAWGFWGDRSLGIGVAGSTHSNASWPIVRGINWFNLENALMNLVAPNFPNENVLGEIASTLRKNYQR